MQTGFEAKAAFDPSRFVKPRYEPSRVDIQFYCNFKKVYTDISLELPKDDQVLLLQGFNDVLSPKRDDGKRFSSTSEDLKNGSPDQKSRFRTCAQAVYSSFSRTDHKASANARNKMQHVGSLDEKTKDSGTFSISDAIFISCSHVFVWIRSM